MSAESLLAFIAKLTSISVTVTEEEGQKLAEMINKWSGQLDNISGGTELAASSSNLPFIPPLSNLPSTSAASTVTLMANSLQSSPPPFLSAPVSSSSSNSVQSLPCAVNTASKNADQIVVTPKTTMPSTTAFPVVLPMVPQNGLPGMPQLFAIGLPNDVPKNMVKTPTNGIVAVPPIPATVPAAANVMAFGMRNSFARQKGTPVMPGMVQRRALTKSAAAAACAHGVCGISVARAGGGGVAARPANNGAGAKTWQMMHQRREQRQALSMRRAVAGAAIPSAAYLSAGSKLYQQQQQQQQTTPAVPPSFAYLSAGSKLAFRRHNQQTQQLQQQQKMAPQPTACCSSAADTTNMMETDTADKQ